MDNGVLTKEEILAVEDNSAKYGWLEYFFLVSEFAFGMTVVEEKMVQKVIGSGEPNALNGFKYFEPVFTIFSLYAADSFFGKIPTLLIFTGGIGVVQAAIFVCAVTDSLGNATGDALNLLIYFVTDVHRPLRWALTYAIKPKKPFEHMRQWIVLLEAAYLFGKFSTKLIIMIPGVAKFPYLDMVLPPILIVNYSVYAAILVMCFKKRTLPTYFELFAVDKSIRDLFCMITKKCGKTFQGLQNRPHNQALCVGILITLAVFVPFTAARFDNEVVKIFVKNNKDFLSGRQLKIGMDTVAPFTTGIALLVIEYAVTPLLKRIGLHPYYICWLSFSYVVVLTSFTMMTYTYIQLESEMPFPMLPPGKAHLTVFNCLPASLEVEWPSRGEIDRVQNLDYARKILVNVQSPLVNEIVLQNKPVGMYGQTNITLVEGKENVFVVNYDGITRANMSERLAFDRYMNKKAQIRILDCFEVCCHGSLTITPKKLSKKLKEKQKPITIKLTRNLLSKRIDVYEGTYSISYQPEDNVTLHLGTVNLERIDKVVLHVNSIQHPSYKLQNMVAISSKLVDLYIPISILDAIFRISHAYQKMIVVYLTDRKIFSFMFGIHFMLTRIADFLSTSFYHDKNHSQDKYFVVMGLSGLCFIAYMFAVIKFKRHFNPTVTIELEQETQVSQRPRKSFTSYDSTEPNKQKAL